MLFDDMKKPVFFKNKLKYIGEIVDELQKKTPYFEFNLVITGLKIVGQSHILKMLKHIKEGASSEDKRLAELISGFDMVNEEDFTPEISAFAPDIVAFKNEVTIDD